MEDPDDGALPKEDEQPRFEAFRARAPKTASQSAASSARRWVACRWSRATTARRGRCRATPSPEGSIGAGLDRCVLLGDERVHRHGRVLHRSRKRRAALIERYNGTSWQLQESPSPVGKPAPKGSHWALSRGVVFRQRARAWQSAPTTNRPVARNCCWARNGTAALELALPVDRTTGVLYDEPRGVSCQRRFHMHPRRPVPERNKPQTLTERWPSECGNRRHCSVFRGAAVPPRRCA